MVNKNFLDLYQRLRCLPCLEILMKTCEMFIEASPDSTGISARSVERMLRLEITSFESIHGLSPLLHHKGRINGSQVAAFHRRTDEVIQFFIISSALRGEVILTRMQVAFSATNVTATKIELSQAPPIYLLNLEEETIPALQDDDDRGGTHEGALIQLLQNVVIGDTAGDLFSNNQVITTTTAYTAIQLNVYGSHLALSGPIVSVTSICLYHRYTIPRFQRSISDLQSTVQALQVTTHASILTLIAFTVLSVFRNPNRNWGPRVTEGNLWRVT